MTFKTDDIPKPNEAKTNSYDSAPPPNLIQFMLKDWKAVKRPAPPVKYLPHYRKRREALSRKFLGNLVVVPSGHRKVRNNDCFYSFRPCSDFFYLTGNTEPDCVLVLIPEGKAHRPVLFVEPNPGKTDVTFFTDRNKGELWEGARLGVPESQARFGIQDCRSLEELEKFLLSSRTNFPVRILFGHCESIEKSLSASSSDAKHHELATFLSEMRLLKDDAEIKEVTLAVKATKRGFEDVIQRLRTATSERELEGVFYTRARMEGNDVGYSSIVASGAHACTLHWKKNDGKLRKGDLLLLDAGIEAETLYTADVTRTLPISGTFTKEQKAIYDLVHAAQAAAFKKVNPGNDFMEPNRVAMEVLAHGLQRLGIIESAEVSLKPENQFYKRYTLHNISHMLGLDVHDCAAARAETYKYGKLEAGMVLTVEPGLYFQPDDLTVPGRYRGIGVRIEDDVVVTEKGYRNLSAILPSQSDDVQDWVKSLLKKK